MRNEKLVEKLFEKLEALKGCCGLDVNRSNKEALWLGKAIPQSTNRFNINWPTKCVCLGVSFSRDLKVSTQNNFEKSLSPWKSVLTSGPLVI